MYLDNDLYLITCERNGVAIVDCKPKFADDCKGDLALFLNRTAKGEYCFVHIDLEEAEYHLSHAQSGFYAMSTGTEEGFGTYEASRSPLALYTSSLIALVRSMEFYIYYINLQKQDGTRYNIHVQAYDAEQAAEKALALHPGSALTLPPQLCDVSEATLVHNRTLWL